MSVCSVQCSLCSRTRWNGSERCEKFKASAISIGPKANIELYRWNRIWYTTDARQFITPQRQSMVKISHHDKYSIGIYANQVLVFRCDELILFFNFIFFLIEFKWCCRYVFAFSCIFCKIIRCELISKHFFLIGDLKSFLEIQKSFFKNFSCKRKWPNEKSEKWNFKSKLDTEWILQ